MGALASKAAPHLEALNRDGYCIIENAIDPERVAALNRGLDPRFAATPFCDGDFYGRRTRRFGRLLAVSAEASGFVAHPLILDIVDALLSPHCDRFNLNLTQAIEIHPGALPQFPHRDEDMWQGPKGELHYLVNVLWPLSPFRKDNGATLIWPQTHRGRRAGEAEAEPIVAAMDPGAVLLFLGSTLHGGGGNISAGIRRGLIVSYCLGWLKPFENQWLAYPPAVARHFAPELAALAGYSLHRPNLGNYEGQCPSVLLGDDVPQHLAAIDALTPEQQSALADHVAGQRGLPLTPGAPAS